MKRKKLPGFVSNPILIEIFQSRAGRVFTNWVLQGILYMNPVEIAYKLLLDVVLAISIWLLFFQSSSFVALFFALFIAHTINWIINGQPVALLMHIDIGKGSAEKFINYVEALEKRINKQDHIAACAAYGSLSRGNYKPTSDIDIRLIMKKDFFSQVKSAHFCFVERMRAFLSFFPLDLYAFTLDEVQRKMNPKEPPIIFYDKKGLLQETYQELVSFEEFDRHFREVVLLAQSK